MFDCKVNMLKTLFHEMRYHRNNWAHQQGIDERMLYRMVDSALLILEILKYDQSFASYQRLLFIRKEIIKELARQACVN